MRQLVSRHRQAHHLAGALHRELHLGVARHAIGGGLGRSGERHEAGHQTGREHKPAGRGGPANGERK